MSSVPAILLFTKIVNHKNEKCLKFKVIICVLQSNVKKYTFLGISLAVMKTRKKSLLFFIKSLILFGFFSDISEPIFLSNICISLIAQKLEREISRVFPALCLSVKRRKSIFFSLPLFGVFGGQLSNKGGNPNFRLIHKCSRCRTFMSRLTHSPLEILPKNAF